jgi:hypothetical protein
MFKVEETYKQLEKKKKLPKDGNIIDQYMLKDDMVLQ